MADTLTVLAVLALVCAPPVWLMWRCWPSPLQRQLNEWADEQDARRRASRS